MLLRAFGRTPHDPALASRLRQTGVIQADDLADSIAGGGGVIEWKWLYFSIRLMPISTR